MNDGPSFEAELEEHLRAVRTAAQEAKVRVAQGVAGLSKPPAAPAPPEAAFPEPSFIDEIPEAGSHARHQSAVNFDESAPRGAAPSYDPGQSDILDSSMDDGIPVWEDPT